MKNCESGYYVSTFNQTMEMLEPDIVDYVAAAVCEALQTALTSQARF